ncbi:mini-chromosome maintenance complex-binding protein [Aplysia californica]|uniref:Mini-chromosome maintenance complex-binding protein n=1 Tax=Aplysia californica TaxID=6500 RepID=A0ABM0JHU5_APLCA|nr:mini-chromosome maintenance complex-binding protein [Aplysia californica]
MPGIEDWKTKPLSVINSIYEENSGESYADFIKKVQEYFTQRLDQLSLLSIPSLNTVSLDELRSNTVVKYRCMVQDVFDPQFCLGKYKIVNSKTQKSRVECGAFRDFPDLQPDESVDFESPENITVDRQGFYCVPIPGEAEWVKEGYKSKDVERKKPSSSQESRPSKRDREAEGDPELSEKTCKRVENVSPPNVEDKQQETSDMDVTPPPCSSVAGASQQPTMAKGVPMNFPLPEEKGFPCIVRVYSNDVELKATDFVEIVGVLSIDPQLAAIYDDDAADDAMDQEELQAHEPPPSLVPRLHALVIRPLQHNNPQLPALSGSETYKQAVSQLMQDAGSLRLELLSVLEHALLCDRLAAEYLLCHLVSKVYARADVLPLGKLCVNLSRCPVTQRYTKFLNHLISQLAPQAVLLEMSIESTNNWTLIPKKDYKVNRITAGMLQLAPGTCLVLDETALQQGQLNHTGVMNVKALADVINWQKVDYDFEFHPIPVYTDVNVLILSEGESLLPKDILLPVAINNEILDFPDHFAKLDGRLSPENLNKLRSYITACRLIDYSVSEETQKVIQDDFVDTRQRNPKDMTIEDFQRLLGLVRLLTLTYGLSSPTVELWNKVRSMEEERKIRLAQQPRAAAQGNQ